MEVCNHCGKGFCQSRVRRVFRGLAGGFCSPICYNANTYAGATEEHDEAEKVLAGEIFDALSEEGFIPDHLATDPDRFAEAVAVILPLLKNVN